jgi:aminobutyraldehyde dehydrogenase
LADLSRAANELKFNLPSDDENEIGPLISSTQKGRVQGFVERAGG